MPDYIKIRTAQNVEIKYKLAGLGNRVLAKLLDIIVIFGYSIGMGFLLNYIGIDGWGMMAFFLPVFLFSLLFELFNNGQTPGKSITRTKVVSMDGAPLSTSQILTRWLLQPVDTWLLTGLPGIISIVSGDTQQRLGDRSASTIVVSLKESASLEQTAFTKIEETYRPVYTQTSQLAENDIRIIQTVLSDRSDNRYTLMSRAAAKMEDILEVKKTTSSQEFLKALVKDYNFYQQDNSTEDEDIPY